MGAEGWVAIIIATGAQLGALLSIYLKLRRGQTDIKDQGAETHDLVNGNQAEMVARVDQLTAALTAGGLAVPPVPRRGQTERISPHWQGDPPGTPWIPPGPVR